jgi:hypothetical protein
MFGRIGDALPRFRSYQALFPSHEALLIALSKVYLDIIRFSIDAKNLFLRAHKSPGEYRSKGRFLNYSGQLLWQASEKTRSYAKRHRRKRKLSGVLF